MLEPLAIISRLARCKRPRISACPLDGFWLGRFHRHQVCANTGRAMKFRFLPVVRCSQGGPDEMRRFTFAMPALMALIILSASVRPAAAQYTSSSKYGTNGVQAPSLSDQNAPANIPEGEMALPQ